MFNLFLESIKLSNPVLIETFQNAYESIFESKSNKESNTSIENKLESSIDGIDNISDNFIKSVLIDINKEIENLPKSINTDENIKIKLLRTLPDGIKVYSVNGTIVRRDIDNDFCLGANWMADPHYKGMGKHEIWIEKILDNDPTERACIEIHEICESHFMYHYKMNYKDAHHLASHVELFWRKKLNP